VILLESLADLLLCYPCERQRAIYSSGSGLTANRINLFNASGLYLAFNMMFRFVSTSVLL